MRLILSLLIVAVVITYLIVPFVKYLKRVAKSELKRIDKNLTEEQNSKEEEEKF